MTYLPNPARFNTHRATLEQGPQIVNGQLVWTSATGITTADPQSFGGCLRKWWYDQVAGRKPPATKAMLAGTDLHSEIEGRLLRGTSLQSPLALAGARFVPHAGSGLFIEKPIHFTTRDGIQIYGHVDLYNLRQQYIDPEGVLQQDPPWSFEVKDWKTTSSFDFAKTERELAENIQLTTYAEAGFRLWPDFEHSRYTHVYFRTRGRPEAKLVTIRRSRDEVAARWGYSESVIRTMRDAAREPNVDLITANTRSCTAYSGCAHVSYCSAYQRSSLDALYNKIADDWNNVPPSGVVDAQGDTQMGLIAQTQPQLMQQQGPAPAPQQNMQQQLAAEENAMRQQVAQQQQQMPTQFNAQEFLTVCHRLGTYGFGMPSLAGNAAQAYATAAGQSVAPGFVFQGVLAPPGAQYSLHQMTLTEVAQVYQIEREAAAKAGVQQAPGPNTQQLVQPVQYNAQTQQYVDARYGVALTTQPTFGPPSEPVQAPPGSPPFTQQLANAYNNQFATPSFLPPGAPESMPQLAQQQSATPAPQAEAPAAEAPKKAGRPKKPKNDSGTAPETAAPPAAQTAGAPPTLPSSAGAPTQVAPAAGPTIAVKTPGMSQDAQSEPRPVVILINARPVNGSSRSLSGYVDYINTSIATRYNVTKDGKQGPLDVRAAVDGSILGYGGWKGVVREIVKVDPPNVEGDCHLDTHGELYEIVADALREVAEEKGWAYYRGIR